MKPSERISVEELRIGNWALDQLTRTPQQIQFLEKEMRLISKPIPLTPEWLEKFGFEKTQMSKGYTFQLFDAYEDYYGDNHHTIEFHLMDGVIKGLFLFWRIKYVHQLQNLFYCLTGTELELK